MRVRVYRNLHTRRNRRDLGRWSVMSWEGQTKGRVIDHRDVVVLQDCKLIVQPAGNARVRREGVKNVHAFIEGQIDPLGDLEGYTYRGQIVYDPYKHQSFRLLSEDREISKYDGIILSRQVIAFERTA